MKGVSVKQVRNVSLAILDKVRVLLSTEPARMIGYGAAVVVYLTVRLVGELRPGIFPVIGFDEAVTVTLTALASVLVIVESIRRFVFSPQTYIEDLSDEAEAAHEAAHIEEDARRMVQALRRAALEAEAAEAEQPGIPVAPAPKVSTKGQN